MRQIERVMNVKKIIEEFQDNLAPKLDIYEQAIYLYILRHSRLQEKEEITIGFKSARLKMAFGIGEKGKPISESVCYERLRSLELKGCLRRIGTERQGTRVHLYLPSEIQSVIPLEEPVLEIDIEDMDFFTDAENRTAILHTENHKCFYCCRVLNSTNHVIEHVVSRPEGNNSYRNLVVACIDCNNRKNKLPVEDFLCGLYRDGFLSADDFENRCIVLQKLRDGELKPNVNIN